MDTGALLSAQAVVENYFDALNVRDYARAAGAIAEHCVWESVATEAVHQGPGAIVAGLREFVVAFPDWHVHIASVTADGNRVAIEWLVTGTFTKAFRGMQPNGRRMRRRGCAVAEVEGGKIVAYRDYYDRLTLQQQLRDEPRTASPLRGRQATPSRAWGRLGPSRNCGAGLTPAREGEGAGRDARGDPHRDAARAQQARPRGHPAEAREKLQLVWVRDVDQAMATALEAKPVA